MLRVVSAPELGDVAGAVFSVWGSLFLHPPTPTPNNPSPNPTHPHPHAHHAT